MIHATQLPAHVLAEIVSQIQQLLWLDTDPSGDFWNGDKEWDCETIESIAAVLYEHGLRPEEDWADGDGRAVGY